MCCDYIGLGACRKAHIIKFKFKAYLRDQGWTVLHVAATKDLGDLIPLLVEARADIEAREEVSAYYERDCFLGLGGWGGARCNWAWRPRKDREGDKGMPSKELMKE